MYARIKQNDSESWQALALLKELTSKSTRLDFRIRFNDYMLHIGVVWITFTMRQRFLQYCDILFLDAPKRGYNKLCWLYIGPTIKPQKNTNSVVAESLFISKDINTYEWILFLIAEMKPKWSLRNLIIIFADRLITEVLI